MKKDWEKENNFKYDIVARIRPDLLILEDTMLPDDVESWDMTKVHTMNHDEWHGYCDRFHFSMSENDDIISDSINSLRYYSSIGGRGYGEAFLQFVIHLHGLEVERFSHLKTCLLRKDGTKDGEFILIEKGVVKKHHKDFGIIHTSASFSLKLYIEVY